MGAATFIHGLTSLLNILITGLPQLKKVGDEKKRRESLLAILGACYAFVKIAEKGKDLLELTGRAPVDRVTQMAPERRTEYSQQCEALLSQQLNILVHLNCLLQSAAVLDLLSPKSKQELLDLIGWKETGLASITTAVGFYVSAKRTLSLSLAENEEIEKYGPLLADFRYQGQMAALLLIPPDNENYLIDVKQAKADLDELLEAGERLRQIINATYPAEEVIKLAKSARDRLEAQIRP